MPFIQYQDCNFTADRAAKIDTANTIISEYHRQGYTLTLRQLYYQFVARGLIENTERSYKNLGSIVADGRVAGLIDWNAIEDRGRSCSSIYVQEDEQDCLRGLEYHYSLDFWERQKAYVEVWVEKEALAAVVQRPADRWQVPYMACKGYLSVSEAWRAGRRFEQKEAAGCERMVVIHLGDHDPSGIDMSRDNRDRLQLFSNESSVELHRIALNMDQVEQYNPPPNPAKVTDSRAADYIARFGHTSWELDALEPRVLDKLISDKIREFVDMDLWQETEAEQQEARKVLARLHSNWPEVREYVEGLPE
jgi:hypothetical protein